MIPDAAIIEPDKPVNQPPSTAGMTTKVVKGSLWTLAGHIGPSVVALVSTPFVIRMLGAEKYGVLILVGLIPSYLGFADFGMSIASTKFASESYAEGDFRREARIVRTAALVALCSSLPSAIVLFVFSSLVVALFSVPEHLQTEAALALKIAAVTFVLHIMNGIFNSPQLTRLRMDTNAWVTSGFRILGLLATPLAVYYWGVVGAVTVLMFANLLILGGHLFFFSRLSNHFFEFTFDFSSVKPMLQFGLALVGGGIAVAFLINIEKLILTKLTSVEMLAYYSVAATFALLATTFTGAMVQSLIPAFTQLIGRRRTGEFDLLFWRMTRLNSVWIPPAIAALFIIAEPFFSVWAGADFGLNSTPPFYILIAGLSVHLMALIPYCALIAAGKTGLVAKLYWFELVVFTCVTLILIYFFGIIGAALAWSVRGIFEGVMFSILATPLLKDRSAFFRYAGQMVLGFLLLSPAMVLSFFMGFGLATVLAFFFCVSFYCLWTWSKVVQQDEKSRLTVFIMRNRLARQLLGLANRVRQFRVWS